MMKEHSEILRQITSLYSLKIAIAFSFLVSVNSLASAESVITNGTTLRVSVGTTVVNAGALALQNGSTLTNQGTLILAGNLNNLNASVLNLGTGTINLAGTSAQQKNGQNTIQNLTINNAAGVSLNANNTVNGVLTLISGRLALGSNNLFLGTSATVAGAPSAAAMVVATGTGQLRKSFSAAGSFSFPVGDNTVMAEYAPVTVSFTGSSYGAGNYVGVNLANSAYPGATGSYINRYWNVTQSGITGFTCNATFKYMQADVVGTENLIYCLRATPTSVNYYSATNVATDLLAANGLTEFGDFTGIQQLADKTLNLTVFLEGLYDGGGTMRKAQNASGDQFTGATADQINVELHSSSGYGYKIFSVSASNLSTTGVSAITIPGLFGGSYYVTVRHRNSLETVTAAPVSFAGGTISYSFSGPEQAYGGNLQLMTGGVYAIYGGDVNQGGGVDTADMTPVETDATNFVTGYLPTDVNGDGVIDTADMTIVDNNGANSVTVETP